jgi:DNA-binding LacI/PurR family transcriptional regulator
MVDLRVNDPRVAELVRLGLPAVVVGGPVENRALPAVWHDEASVVVEAVRYLAALGHRRVAHVTGVPDFAHTVQRVAAFRKTSSDLALEIQVVETDYSAEQGARATRKLLSLPSPPSAIMFDSDLLAVTGLGVAQQMGLTVPDDVSIVGWDDSLISQVVHPPLTAITRDIEAFGIAATRHLLAVIEGKAGEDVETVRGELTPRGSTARARQAAG